jgi:DNA polymerase-4
VTAPALLCRDCFTADPGEAEACRQCGGRRLIGHAELASLSISHIDCDAFYATIEKRDDPSLADKPLIIGGGKRGVVTTACYIARKFGVKSAMPMFKALKLCPQATIIPPNMEKYGAVGREVRRLMLELTPLVEPLSIDEAFLDLSGTERLHHAMPAASLARLARRVEDAVGITVSVGLSFNKFLAKIASDRDKPRGFSVIGRGEATSFLAAERVGLIWGVGPVMQRRLLDDGIETIGQLQAMTSDALTRRYGSMGERLYHLSRAEDDRKVEPNGEAKSISAETTFEEDISDPAELTAIARRLCERVSRRLRKAGLAANGVTLKLKTADFRLRTRSRQLSSPTVLADRIHKVAADLLVKEANGTRFRLIGVGTSDFAEIAGRPARSRRSACGPPRRRGERDGSHPQPLRQQQGRDRPGVRQAGAA